MTSLSSLVLVLSVATASPTVAILPFSAEAPVSKKEAARVSALTDQTLRNTDGLWGALPRTKRDRKDAARCRLDAVCLSDLAFVRGADLLLGGVIAKGPDGLLARVVVVVPKGGKDPVRVFEEPLGDEPASRQLGVDRLLRRAFRPDALAGDLWVEGEPAGAEIRIDGVVVGVLPLTEPVPDVVEGEHQVELRHDGYVSLSQTVDVRFREKSVIRLVLSPVRVSRLDEREPFVDEEDRAFPLGPVVAAGAGVVALGVGAGFGVGAWLTQGEVERRAGAQQLVFPKDADLVRTGQGLAFTANVFYLLGALSTAAGGTWWWLQQPSEVESASGGHEVPSPPDAADDVDARPTLRSLP